MEPSEANRSIAILCAPLGPSDALRHHTDLLADSLNRFGLGAATSIFGHAGELARDSSLAQYDSFVIQHTWLLWGNGDVRNLVGKIASLGPVLVHFHDPPFPGTSVKARVRSTLQRRQAQQIAQIADAVGSSIPVELAPWLHAAADRTFIATPSNFEFVTPQTRPNPSDVVVVPRRALTAAERRRLVEILERSTVGRSSQLTVRLLGRASMAAAAELPSEGSGWRIDPSGELDAASFGSELNAAKAVLQPFEGITTRSGIAACAMAFGVPVVGWTTSSSFDELRRPELGFLHEPDLNALGARLRELVDCHDARHEVAAAQLRFYRTYLSWATAASSVTNALARSAKRRGLGG